MWIERIKSLFRPRKGYRHLGRHGIQAEPEETRANWYGKSERVEEEYIGDGIHRNDNLDAPKDQGRQRQPHDQPSPEEKH